VRPNLSQFNMIPFFQLYKQKKPKQHLIKTKREKKKIYKQLVFFFFG